MKLWSKRAILAVTEIAVVGLMGAGLAFAQPASPEKPLLVEQVFKNIQVLKGITVDRRFHGDHGAHESRPSV
jgi:hypothetical protein